MLLDKRIPLAFIINKIKYDMLAVLGVICVILVLTTRYAFVIPELPLTIPVFLGTSISILLSFKLNQSYDRWWEARKIWGSIVNDSRTLVLQLQGFLPDGNKDAIRTIARRQIAWCYILSRQLRGHDPLHEMSTLMSAQDLSAVSLHANKALAVLQLHTLDVKDLRTAGHLDPFSHVQIDDTLVRLCDSQGRAERIKSTVFPVTYRKYLHYLIYLFVITLSVSLNNVSPLYEMPVLLLISSAFFLLEKSATHMQDPFDDKPTDTAMTAISTTIDTNLKQLIGDADLPPVISNENFYLK